MKTIQKCAIACLLSLITQMVFSQIKTDAASDYNVAQNALYGKDYERAITYYNKSLYYDSKYPYTYNELAWCYCFMGQYTNAIREATRAIDLFKYHLFYDTRATAYALSADYANAIADLNMAIKLERSVAMYYFRRGSIKLIINDIEGSELDFKKGWELDKKGSYFSSVDPLLLLPAFKFPLTDFVKKHVEEKIAAWQQKGEFEKMADFQARVTEASRSQKLQEFTDEAIGLLKLEYTKSINWKKIKISKYDAENETFLMQPADFPEFALNVPLAEAPIFKANFDKMTFMEQDYYPVGNQLVVSKLAIVDPVSNKKYAYDSKKASNYAANNIAYNFKPIEINLPANNAATSIISESSTVVGSSDVDVNIPITDLVNGNTFAVIIANENYTREIKVRYAAGDGKIFKEYCEKTLGIPAKNIQFLQDATYGSMRSAIKWISDVTAAFNGQAKIIFYYAGHGMPNEADKSAYLLPTDGFSSDFETAIKLDDLYNRLTASPAQSVTVFLDACFSGSVRDNGMLANARGVNIKPRMDVLKGNMVVFSAATGDETAYPYKEKQHGLFTYFLLKKLQDTKGDITYQGLSDYIIENVRQQSIVVNQKSQTPQVNAAFELQNKWKSMKIK